MTPFNKDPGMEREKAVRRVYNNYSVIHSQFSFEQLFNLTIFSYENAAQKGLDIGNSISYIRTIAKNICLEELKRLKPSSADSPRGKEPVKIVRLDNEVVLNLSSNGHAARNYRELLDYIKANLDEKSFAYFKLIYIHDLKKEEISKRMKVSLATVYNKRDKLDLKLRIILKNY